MTLEQALQMTLFKAHKVYIEDDDKTYGIERLEDLKRFCFKREVDQIIINQRATTIIMKDEVK